MKWFDVYKGSDLNLTKSEETIDVDIESKGYGAILCTSQPVDQVFLNEMKQLTSIPLGNFSATWNFLPQIMQNLSSNVKGKGKNLRKSLFVPGGELFFNVKGNCIEGLSTQ